MGTNAPAGVREGNRKIWISTKKGHGGHHPRSSEELEVLDSNQTTTFTKENTRKGDKGEGHRDTGYSRANFHIGSNKKKACEATHVKGKKGPTPIRKKKELPQPS